MYKFKIDPELGEISVVINKSASPQYVLLLAHGAGAGLQHDFMHAVATAMARQNGVVIRFNFPYMEKNKKLPGASGSNIYTIGKMIAYAGQEFAHLPLFLAGKSYGGRMGSHWVVQNPEQDAVKGLIYFGFPLHAPGKPSLQRAEHLYDISLPQLFIQGTRDRLADYDLIGEVIKDCRNAYLQSVEQGDHSLKVPKKYSPLSHQQILTGTAQRADRWIIENL
ncbi:MAG: alpha/beta hydrolase family protein [Candidatus Cyclobacteriaceae bacterium M3_2C_046]